VPPRAARRWIVANGAFVAAGLLASFPVVLSTVHALAIGWYPVGDDGIIAARAYDVFTLHPPLVGAYSATSVVLGQGSHHPGPMLYWLLAIPARFGGPAAMALTIGAMNTAAVFGAVAIARRRGGHALMVVAAGTLAVASVSLVGHVYSDVWNPAAGLLPFTLLIFLAWTIGCGDVQLLPLAALVLSFTVQCHLTFVPPSAGLLVVAAVGLVAGRIRPSRRTWIITGAVLLLCWIGPLADEVVHRPGNLEILARTAFSGTPTTGFETGVRAVTHTIGVPPWWLSIPAGASDRIADIAKAPGAGSIASAAVVLVLLAGLLVLAVRRRRRDIAVAAAVALVLSLSIGLVAGSNPTKGLLVLSLAYTLWWGTAAGAWAWMTLVVGLVALFAPRRLELTRRPRALAALAVAAAAVAIARLAVAGPGEDLQRPHFSPMRALADRLETTVPDGATVLVTGTASGGFGAQYDYLTGSIYALRHDGHRVLTPQSSPLGGKYDPRGRRPDYVVRLVPANAPAGRGLVLLRTAGARPEDGVIVTAERTR
jgi:hypothetical protein